MSSGGYDMEQMGDNRVTPVMREAVAMVQMVLFKVLRQDLHDRYVDRTEPFFSYLTGAVLNNLFGERPLDPAVERFAADNRELVERELRELADRCPDLRPMLTDALRMKTICDNQEGIHSIPSLLMAKALGILQEERALPMPSTFMLQVRTLAAAHGLIEPMQADAPEDPPA